jgi:hypothetical protein
MDDHGGVWPKLKKKHPRQMPWACFCSLEDSLDHAFLPLWHPPEITLVSAMVITTPDQWKARQNPKQDGEEDDAAAMTNSLELGLKG